MTFEIVVVSKQVIKPSSPTPRHLHHHPLSFLDQISPPVYMPITLFYPPESDPKSDPNTILNLLKTSLSETLTRFYPLAGRLVGNSSIDCNDGGVPFIETRVGCRVSDVVGDMSAAGFERFLPCELHAVDGTLFAVQVNFFACGGVAVGTCTCHKIADALSLIMLITSWAATARRDNRKIITPQFDSAALFPPMNISGYAPTVGITRDSIVLKRFLFESSKVAELREKYSDGATRASRVEALSAFIWSRYVASTAGDENPSPGSPKFHIVLHAVNLRPRTDPPLPENSFGNLYRIAVATPNHRRSLVEQMRQTIREIDGDYVKRLQKGKEHLNFIKNISEKFNNGEIMAFNFTSLCRLPVYDIDFGWGKPTASASARLMFKNLVTFMDTREGGGIEAWVNLEREDMAKFEVDEELLNYIS